ncbi:hypothetical protein [Rubinisphaera italica]|uniref:Uncharacterized protein n=1 Tax=Rubinisphaera italica TaxID=2527969 RepID=A0A5C5XA66_9PLAN|nr:hypothetical protein [Rubinisphaera italica]TWT59589.1 hypothetical protein Pan54_02970 [Rubinisphaera italica]
MDTASNSPRHLHGNSRIKSDHYKKEITIKPQPVVNSSSTGDQLDSDAISDQTLRKWALLLANAEMDWPDELTPQQQMRLLLLVREQRRVSLLTLMARIIAKSLVSEEFQRKT